MKNYSDYFGPVLRRLRQENEMTQEELAFRVGVVPSHISMLESSKKFPHLEMLFKIAEALGVQPSKLIEEMENRIKKY